MAALSLFPSNFFLPFSPHRHHLLPFDHLNRRLQCRSPLTSSASSDKFRASTSKKLISDAELCDGLRQFVASVGLPYGHVPSTKELIKHGRKDLANIVRRRGHRLIKELLEHYSDGETNKLDLKETGTLGIEGNSMDYLNSISNVNGFKGYPAYIEDSVHQESMDHDGAFLGHFSSSSNVDVVNGNVMTVADSALPAPRKNQLRDCISSAKLPPSGAADSERNNMGNQDEIDHLKFLLHQKELELSQLQKQIEKEKEALSILQSQAESEISKAEKLISEIDAELQLAEESLSGLKEVQIQYSSEGETVELAGNFNGWHQRIKMDLKLPPVAVDPSESRKCWSITLWLYPGVYEIKFIVDGDWRVDPRRESITRGGIVNNIVRVV